MGQMPLAACKLGMLFRKKPSKITLRTGVSASQKGDFIVRAVSEPDFSHCQLAVNLVTEVRGGISRLDRICAYGSTNRQLQGATYGVL